MVNHLENAKMYTHRADCADSAEWGQFRAQLAIAHALIALVERMDKAANDAEAAAEREDLIRERMASRQISERML